MRTEGKNRAYVFGPISARAAGASSQRLARATAMWLRRAAAVAWSVPIAITFNDGVASIARVPDVGAVGCDDARASARSSAGSASESSSSSSSRCEPSTTASDGGEPAPSPSPQHCYVLLDRFRARRHMWRRGQVVHLRSPHDPDVSLAQRLVALEGDWVTRRDGGGAVVKIPKGHCWLEAAHVSKELELEVDAAEGRGGRRSAARGGGSGPGDGAAIAADDVGVAPVALLDGVVAAVVWPPSRAAIARRALSSDRVLMRAERGTDGHEY